MTGEKVFVLDANVLIDPARSYYAFDLVPAFWRLMVGLAKSGRIESIDRVHTELQRGNDDLADWAGRDFADAFARTDTPAVVQAYARVMQWMEAARQYRTAARTEFANGADGWLVAYAMAHGRIIATNEKANPESKVKVPLPNVSAAFDVECVDIFEMLRRLGARVTG